MFGIFGMLMIACIAAYVMARNKVFLSLAVFVAAALLHYLVQIGFGGWRMWPGSVYLNQAMQWTAPLLAMAACASSRLIVTLPLLVCRLTPDGRPPA